MKYASLICITALVLVAVIWSVFEVQTLMDTSGKMVGMHPLVLFAIPFGLILTLIALALAAVRKSFACALLAFLPILVLTTPIFFAYQINIASWSAVVQQHSDENQAAIEGTDFSTAQFSEVPYKDHPQMVPVAGFTWPNASEAAAAKNGTFYGFVVGGVPHVYLCPLRNGCRGVAWMPDPNVIDSDQSVRYEYTGIANWYIWTFSA